MRNLISVIAALAVAAIAQVASAQDVPPADTAIDGPVSQVEDITVEGRRIDGVVRDFVSGVSAVHEDNGQVARFGGRVCPGTINLPRDIAQTINDRIARAALVAGLAVGRPGCSPNVLVIATEDSDLLATRLMQTNRREFAFHVADQQRGLDLLAEFSQPGRVVRWWHITERDQFGHDGSSRLRAAYETDIIGSIIVLDTKRIGPVTLTALGDYVALTALARLSPDADLVGLDTVLNLFSLEPSARPATMTAWDEAYLEALYSARGDAIVSRFQFRDIADRMVRRYERSRSAEATTAPE